jgi:phage-related protein (TIGR01555 family)
VNKISSGRVALIGEGEELTKTSTTLTGFHEMMDRYAKYIAAASNIPLSRFFSGEGGELNGNTMEGDLVTYYDWVKELQEDMRRPVIEKILEFFSYYMKFDPSKIDFKFTPLWQMTEQQFAEVLFKTTLLEANQVSAEDADKLMNPDKEEE